MSNPLAAPSDAQIRDFDFNGLKGVNIAAATDPADVPRFDQIPAASPQFEPDRTMFVAKSWPAGVDTSRYFTDPQVALNTAALLVPAPGPNNPASVLVYPGTYLPGVDVVWPNADNISLVAADGSSEMDRANDPNATLSTDYNVIIGRDISFTPTGGFEAFIQGIKVPRNLLLNGNGRIFKAKNSLIQGSLIGGPGSGMVFYLEDSQVIGGINPTGGAAHILNRCICGAFGGGSSTLTPGSFIAATPGCSFGAVNLPAGLFVLGGWDGFDLFQASPGTPASGCLFSNIAIALNGTADIRGSEYTGTLSGAGKIDRSYDTVVVGPLTGAGNTATIPFSPLYSTAPTQIDLTLTSAPVAGQGIPQVSNITANSFDVTDAEPAGRTFLAKVYHK